MENILYFASVGLIVLISLYTILKILIKKFNPEASKVNIYGILQGMKNSEIISLSCSIVLSDTITRCCIFIFYKYSKFVEDFEKWDDEDMNAAESAYYLEVQTRVNKKLLEVAN